MNADPTSVGERATIGTALHSLWRLMDGYRLRYSLAILALLVATAFMYLVPLTTSVVIDLGMGADNGSSKLVDLAQAFIEAEWLKTHLWAGTLAILGFTLTAGGFTFLKGRLAAEASDGIALDLKNRIYDHLQYLPLSYHDQADTGDLVQRSTSDVETLRLALSSQVVEVTNAFILLGTALPILLWMDPRMTLVSLILIVPIGLLGGLFFGQIRSQFLKVDEAEAKVTSVIQENITGLRVVRAFARQKHEIEKFRGPNTEYRDVRLRLIRLLALYWSVSDLIVISQTGLVLGFGVHYISQGSLSVGALFAFLLVLQLLLWPVRQMGRTLTDLGKAIVAIGRIREILDEPVEKRTRRSMASSASGAISIHNLCFKHASGKAALHDISFDLQPGQTLAILGPSGAGKSTLFHLLLRLYDYTQGSIRIDGVELSELDRQWVRSQFATVLQEPFLFSKTIVDNIRLGHPEAHESSVAEAARLADIHDTIVTFPKGYQTLVGERGVTLSGGQRQRVALARALLRDCPFLLLDDALSAVDAETENQIIQALKSRHGKFTTLVIAHRLSTLAHADQAIVLNEGRIIQRGRHAELLAIPGLYKDLWELQNQIENPPMEGCG